MITAYSHNSFVRGRTKSFKPVFIKLYKSFISFAVPQYIIAPVAPIPSNTHGAATQAKYSGDQPIIRHIAYKTPKNTAIIATVMIIIVFTFKSLAPFLNHSGISFYQFILKIAQLLCKCDYFTKVFNVERFTPMFLSEKTMEKDPRYFR